MGIIQRFSDIMEANVNSLIAGLEEKNAEKLLDKYLRDAQQSLEELKSETAAIIADEMAAGRRLASCEAEIAKYQKYAEQAVIAGNDADALRFLEAKNKLEANKAELETDYANCKVTSDRMRQMTKKLIADIDTAEAKIQELKGRLKIAQSKEKIQKVTEKMANRKNSLDGFDSMVDAVQKRIDAVDAKAALDEQLADTMDIKALEQKYSLESAADSAAATAASDLAALKAKLGK